MTKLSELTAEISATNAQLGKAKDEILAKISDLQTALGMDNDLTADQQAALDALKAAAQALDDIVPDAVTPVA